VKHVPRSLVVLVEDLMSLDPVCVDPRGLTTAPPVPTNRLRALPGMTIYGRGRHAREVEW
jgi:hypothetical protein